MAGPILSLFSPPDPPRTIAHPCVEQRPSLPQFQLCLAWLFSRRTQLKAPARVLRRDRGKVSVRENRGKKVTATWVLNVSYRGWLQFGACGEHCLCPRPSGSVTHRKASELWQDVMSASSAGQPGLGARPGPGWAPQGGHLQPSTENIKPNQLGSFSRCTNLFSRMESNKPREPWAPHEAQQNLQASDFPTLPLQQGR